MDKKITPFVRQLILYSFTQFCCKTARLSWSWWIVVRLNSCCYSIPISPPSNSQFTILCHVLSIPTWRLTVEYNFMQCLFLKPRLLLYSAGLNYGMLFGGKVRLENGIYSMKKSLTNVTFISGHWQLPCMLVGTDRTTINLPSIDPLCCINRHPCV